MRMRDTESINRQFNRRCRRGKSRPKRPDIEPLLIALEDGSQVHCNAAIRMLGELGDAEAIEPLLQVIWNVHCEADKYAAVEALTKINGPVIPCVIHLLLSRGKELSDSDLKFLLLLLERFKLTKEEFDKLEPFLINTLSIKAEKIPTKVQNAFWITGGGVTDFWTTRRVAAKVLGQFDTTQLVERLITDLKCSEGRVGMLAAVALGQLGNLQAMAPLVEALQHKDWFVREEVIFALAQLDVNRKEINKLVKGLYDEHPQVRETTRKVLIKVGKDSIPAIIQSLTKQIESITDDALKEALLLLFRLKPSKEQLKSLKPLLLSSLLLGRVDLSNIAREHLKKI
ncbi:MAG: HEAT repeat domain-containing protein [Promethearchaeota archaeon]